MVIAGPTRLDPSQVHATPINGSASTLGATARADAVSFAVDPGQTFNENRTGLHVYDNVPTFLGGAGTAGGPTPTFTWLFLDWTNDAVPFGDDLHQLQVPWPSVFVTHMHFAYLNQVGSATQQIKFHQQLNPSAAETPLATIPLGAGFGSLSFVAPGGGAFIITLTGLSIHLPDPGAWISFDDPTDPVPGPPGGKLQTFWLMGGLPGIGTSHPGLSYEFAPSSLTYFYPGSTYMVFGTATAAWPNISMSLGTVPEPTTIGAVALAGLLALRRRRA
jgi:hypothetical protein